jgi:hypothetical protein
VAADGAQLGLTGVDQSGVDGGMHVRLLRGGGDS